MGKLPDDVMYYISQRFADRDQQCVFGLLDQNHLSTPRIMRSVLFLANGSLSLLKHNIEVCRTDLREILTNAEYVIGIAERPMPIRDMSLPFTDERNLAQEIPTIAVVKEAKRLAPKRASRAKYHQHLVGESFHLGQVQYTVAASQTRPEQIKCYRLDGRRHRIAYLPLVFVLEQLAEHVELAEAVSY
jgi:hypothetical protein